MTINQYWKIGNMLTIEHMPLEALSHEYVIYKHNVIISYYIILYYTILYYIISYHIISYHIYIYIFISYRLYVIIIYIYIYITYIYIYIIRYYIYIYIFHQIEQLSHGIHVCIRLFEATTPAAKSLHGLLMFRAQVVDFPGTDRQIFKVDTLW